MRLTRRELLKTAPIAATGAILPTRRSCNSETRQATELIGTLNTGDVLRVDYPDVYIDRATVAGSVKFIWLSDIHNGILSHYTTGQPVSIIDHIRLTHTDAEYVFVTGDIAENGTVAELQPMKAALDAFTIPVYCVPGNHDEPVPYTIPNTYPAYDSVFNMRQFAFTHGAYRFIGFTSHQKHDQPFENFFWLDDSTKTFIDNEVTNLGTLTPVTLTHCTLSEVTGAFLRSHLGGDNVYALYATNAGYHFGGHRHHGCSRVTDVNIPGMTEFYGGCLSYNQNPTVPHYQVVTLAGTGATVEVYHGRAPYELLFTL